MPSTFYFDFSAFRNDKLSGGTLLFIDTGFRHLFMLFVMFSLANGRYCQPFLARSFGVFLNHRQAFMARDGRNLSFSTTQLPQAH